MLKEILFLSEGFWRQLILDAFFLGTFSAKMGAFPYSGIIMLCMLQYMNEQQYRYNTFIVLVNLNYFCFYPYRHTLNY